MTGRGGAVRGDGAPRVASVAPGELTWLFVSFFLSFFFKVFLVGEAAAGRALVGSPDGGRRVR